MPSLQVGQTELRTAITEYGYGGGADYTALDTDEKAAVTRCLNEGLRLWYDPPPLGGRAHQWSFLEIRATLATNAPYSTGTVTIVDGSVTLAGGTWPAWAADGVLTTTTGIDYTVATRSSDSVLVLDDTTLDVSAGATFTLRQDDYDLPSTFGELLGPLTFRPSDNAQYPLTVVDAGRIEVERMRLRGVGANQPWLCAIRPKPNDATVGTRQQLMLYPGVSAAAVITIPSRVRPDALDDTNLYPWGASDHSGTILAACRAAAEMTFDRQRGPMWNDFLDKLAQSIKRDSRNNKPQVLGQMYDSSDVSECVRDERNFSWAEIRHLGIP